MDKFTAVIRLTKIKFDFQRRVSYNMKKVYYVFLLLSLNPYTHTAKVYVDEITKYSFEIVNFFHNFVPCSVRKVEKKEEEKKTFLLHTRRFCNSILRKGKFSNKNCMHITRESYVRHHGFQIC